MTPLPQNTAIIAESDLPHAAGSGDALDAVLFDSIPGDTSTGATIAVGGSVTDIISPETDQDWYQITLVAGTTYTFNLDGSGSGFARLNDPYLYLFNSSGTEIGVDDDGGPGRNAQIVFTPSISGTYFLGAAAYQAPSYDNVGQYTLTTSAGSGASGDVYSLEQIADFLTSGYWNGSVHSWNGTTITYNLTGLTSEARVLCRLALDTWHDVCNLSFVETTGAAQITFDDSDSGAYASSNWSGTTATFAEVNVGLDWLSYYGTDIDGYSFQTYIHEIGHALGLGHAGPYNGSATYGFDNIYANDTWQYSVMSYFTQDEYDGSSFRWVMTPQVADIVAVTNLYGAAPSTRSGNTTYGFNANAGQLYTFSNYSSAPALTIYDSDGDDTLDCSGYSAHQTLNLSPGTFSSVGGLIGNIAIASLSIIENAIGGSGNDTISGNDAGNNLQGGSGNDALIGGGGDDDLWGGAGADALNGGPGIDRARYDDSWGGLTADLQVASNNSGIAAGDSYVSVENLYGTRSGDSLRGDGGNNTIWGQDGTDSLYGRAGDDTLYGGEGNDRLQGGQGGDLLDGGAGTDVALYFDSPDGLTADLEFAANNSGIAAGDSYVSIENLHGSNGDDSLFGNGDGNTIWGADGNDSLYGRAGDDILFGGNGNDTLQGGDGGDVLDGGEGTDRARYDDSSGGLTADLLETTNNSGIAAGDTYLSIEDLYGTNANDSLRGDDSANTIWGADGNDSLYGRGGNDVLFGGNGNDHLHGGPGADVLDGGAGWDRALYNDSRGGLTVDLQYAVNNSGIATGDSYVSIEYLYGTDRADSLRGDSGHNGIWGGGGNDALYGRDGNDTLFGGSGNDSLQGGPGRDRFVFDTELDTASNIDTIGDFSVADDTIALEGSIFTTLPNGIIAAAAFHVGVEAHDADDRVIYNAETGALFYDADGTGAGAAVQFAALTAGLALTNDDILIV